MRITGAVLRALPASRPFADSRPLQVVELELDEPGPGEVLVRIRAAGVCHSDGRWLTGIGLGRCRFC
jgi:alcohol dehydrogenase